MGTVCFLEQLWVPQPFPNVADLSQWSTPSTHGDTKWLLKIGVDNVFSWSFLGSQAKLKSLVLAHSPNLTRVCSRYTSLLKSIPPPCSNHIWTHWENLGPFVYPSLCGEFSCPQDKVQRLHPKSQFTVIQAHVDRVTYPIAFVPSFPFSEKSSWQVTVCFKFKFNCFSSHRSFILWGSHSTMHFLSDNLSQPNRKVR